MARSRRQRTTETLIYVGRRLYDILNVLATVEEPFIQVLSVTLGVFRYNIEGLFVHREALDRLRSRGILALGEVGKDAEYVALTPRGRELLKKNRIRLDAHIKGTTVQ